MIQDLVLRWTVTTLFVLSAAECVYEIAAGRRSRTGAVGTSLHALMATAMVVMAWPRGAGLPATGPLLFFLLAALWFIALTLGHPEHRLANAYHTTMMLATAWMYATMSGELLPAPTEVAAAGDHHSSMPGMAMPGMGATGTAPFITGLNWVLALGFAVAGVWWLWRLFARRRTEPFPSGRARVGIAAQATMAAGMAIMFAVMV